MTSDVIFAKALASVVVMFGAAAMIWVRRNGNTDTNAGAGIAGWTMILLLVIW